MSFKAFSFCDYFVQRRGTFFSNFGSGSPKEHFCEIILKSGSWPKRRCHFKGFVIFSSGNHFVQRSNFGRGSPKEHFCEIILKSGHWLRRCRCKVFLFLALVAILFMGEEPF